MYKYKKNIRSSLTLTLIILGTIALINYKIDPYKQYGLNSLNPYFHNARYLNPGLVKHYDYNAIIAGASPTENFLTSEIDKILNLKSLKLFISGGTAFEHKKIMQLALEQEKAKTINLLQQNSLPRRPKSTRFQWLTQHPVKLLQTRSRRIARQRSGTLSKLHTKRWA